MNDQELLCRYSAILPILSDEAKLWPFASEPRDLKEMYRVLGLPGSGSTSLPPLYVSFVMSYRWTDVGLDSYRLLDNPMGCSLSQHGAAMRRDQCLWETLMPNGYVRFGFGADADYDPVCFDLRKRQRNGDCRIVKVDHEAILCDFAIREVSELATSFRELVLQTIRNAAKS